METRVYAPAGAPREKSENSVISGDLCERKNKRG